NPASIAEKIVADPFAFIDCGVVYRTVGKNDRRYGKISGIRFVDLSADACILFAVGGDLVQLSGTISGALVVHEIELPGLPAIPYVHVPCIDPFTGRGCRVTSVQLLTVINMLQQTGCVTMYVGPHGNGDMKERDERDIRDRIRTLAPPNTTIEIELDKMDNYQSLWRLELKPKD
ncbi:MAG: hypothetical protein NUV56_01150, partial [Candidatus Uhrbacteria bacterium]|nr:hypothetical protein [Candidatus Uhrbacteria bacterium]